MKVRLEPESTCKNLRMSDLKPGQIAEIQQNNTNPHYAGMIICIDYTGTVAIEVGGKGETWTGLCNIPVRLLTPGEKIVIGDQ